MVALSTIRLCSYAFTKVGRVYICILLVVKDKTSDFCFERGNRFIAKYFVGHKIRVTVSTVADFARHFRVE